MKSNACLCIPVTLGLQQGKKFGLDLATPTGARIFANITERDQQQIENWICYSLIINVGTFGEIMYQSDIALKPLTVEVGNIGSSSTCRRGEIYQEASEVDSLILC